MSLAPRLIHVETIQIEEDPTDTTRAVDIPVPFLGVIPQKSLVTKHICFLYRLNLNKLGFAKGQTLTSKKPAECLAK